MHKFVTKDRISVQNGKVVLTVRAYASDKRKKARHIDIMKIDDEGCLKIRNLYYFGISGWFVAIPGDRENEYGYKYEVIAESYHRNNQTNSEPYFMSDRPTSSELDEICSIYPSFRYVREGFLFNSKRQLIETLKIWKKHPEIELLLKGGFMSLAWNNSFYKLSVPKRKELFGYIKTLKIGRLGWSYNLGELLSAMKQKVSAEDFAEYTRIHGCYKVDYKTFCYLRRRYDLESKTLSFYRDYIEMARKADHNVREDYWARPSDLYKSHDKVMAELRHIEELKEMERQRRIAMEEAERNRRELEEKDFQKNKFRRYMKNIKPFASFNGKVDGYDIFVTEDLSVWESQAEALHQCIIRCNYFDKVARGNCTIVFIQKEGEPKATAEILRDGKIGQFYGNEMDRNNCLPDEEAKEAFYKWFGDVHKAIFEHDKRKVA